MPFEPKNYLYYNNKTGSIYQLSQRKPEEGEFALEISQEEAGEFFSFKKHFSDFQVSFVKGKLSYVEKENHAQGNFFKNNHHHWILKYDENAKCKIIWDLKEQQWIFSLSDEGKNFLLNGVVIPELTFFVTLDTDFDFLVREMLVSTDQLLNESVTFPFISKFELDMQKISISTSVVFDSYSLNKIYE